MRADTRLDDEPSPAPEGGLALHTTRDDAADVPAERVARLAIRETGRTYFVAVESIDWIEGADYYVKLHVSGRVHLLREPLRSLAQRLDPARFARVHRSAIVNLSRIREIRLSSNGEHTLVLDDTTRLRLTRTRRRELEARIEAAPS